MRPLVSVLRFYEPDTPRGGCQCRPQVLARITIVVTFPRLLGFTDTAHGRGKENTTMAKTRGTGLLMVWTDIDA
jgi:hypothetical protein